MCYVTMQITFLTRKFRNGERNLHCDVVHITTKRVSSLTLDCNGVFAIKAYYKSSCKKLSNVFHENTMQINSVGPQFTNKALSLKLLVVLVDI